ncbi:hypothetical protein CTA2_5167 [Colletotrichum tanaceti]|uniref:Uncharacterized protein n=1 Tax=Colletotrichum tanaceti TaxID=1306861 RepID=A0A4U6XIA2_9PEZI|nr:hypothetical protein CTA2_5167 [Colletotrichum tanaceti]TKW55189.1 hypothetical protein CTA1_1248 [Colletotrichum tanaceti]
MRFSLVLAALATLAFAAPGPSMEGEGLERRQRRCTIAAPHHLASTLENPKPEAPLHVAWLSY